MSLLAHFPLNGTLDDISGNNQIMTNVGATIDTEGKIGKAYIFNTLYDYAHANTSVYINTNMTIDVNKSYTIMAWFSQSTNGVIVGYNPPQYNGVSMYISEGLVIASANSNPQTKATSSVIGNEWTHGTAVFDRENSEIKIYINGVLEATTTGWNGSYGVAAPIFIGTDDASAPEYNYQGKINDVRIYDEVLSDKEIYEISKAKILHYTFNQFAESSENLIPNSPINSYPTIGNGHGTQDTTQYNSNTDFSIGVITDVTNNIITVDGSGRTLYTYDAIKTTQSSPGTGITTGTEYFVKVQGTNQYSLHAYNSSQDGSQGYIDATSGGHHVHYSVDMDERITIASDITNMWHSGAHRPNQGLVKEIITDGFEFEGRKHDCVRLHRSFRYPDTSNSYMAYNVKPSVIAGEYYSFSFYVRAYNDVAIGESIHLTLYTNAGWSSGIIGNYAHHDDIIGYEWQKYEMTALAPNSGGTHMYFSGMPVGADIEISEIQCEHVTLQSVTPFMVDERIDIVTDVSGYHNNTSLDLDYSPTWVKEDGQGNGCYYFKNDGSENRNYITLPNFNSPENITMTVWFKTDGGGLGSYHIPINIDGLYHELSLGTSGNFRIGFYINGVRRVLDFNSSTAIDGDWHMLTGSFDGTTIRSYIDGEPVNSTSNFPGTLTQSVRDVNIGRFGTSTTYGPNGYIDDIRIYATALSDSDVKALYQQKASIDNKGNFFTNKIHERYNKFKMINDALNAKIFTNGLSKYTQSNCQVTLTDKGYRIYRTPDVNPTDDGSTMWGGLRIQPFYGTEDNILQPGHKYRFRVHVTGISDNIPYTNFQWSNQMGWGGGGLSPSYTTIKRISLPSNFNGEMDLLFEFEIDEDEEIYKVCTSSYSIFTEGETYLSFRDLAFGWGYSDTGINGTDIYLTDFRLFDITDDNTEIAIKIENSGITNMDRISNIGITDKLLAYYPLNGHLNDYSGNNYNIIDHNPKLESDCVHVTKTNYLEIPYGVDHNVATDPITFSINVKFNTSPTGDIVMSTGQTRGNADSNSRFYVGFCDGYELDFAIYTSGWAVSADRDTITLGQWHHIAIVFDGSKATLYLDGIDQGSKSYSSYVLNDNLYIGRHNDDTNYDCDLYAKNLKIYNKALTAEEVAIEADITNPDINKKMKIHKDGTLYISGNLYEGL